MDVSYRRWDEHRKRVGLYAVAGYLRFRASFCLIAIVLFIIYTVLAISSTSVNSKNPFVGSQEIEAASGNKPGKGSPNIPSANLGKPPGEDSGSDLGYVPEKEPVIDPGKPLGPNPVIDLGYAKYQGVTYGNGITKWLGIRFAAAPIGDLRFAEPQDPPEHSGVQKADKFGKRCWSYKYSPDDALSDEDCLFLDVYAPSNTSTGSKLPVFFFIPGGGFNYNAGGRIDRGGLVLASKGNIIVVTAHYRVGPYGFIASEEIVRSDYASTNNGLKDQRKALQWIQRHISKVGGDPNHVVVGGASAGGASIALQMTAYGGRDDGLFHAVAANSASFGPVLTVAESQYQYDHLVAQLKCTTATDTLACLRSRPASEIQLQNRNIPYPQAHVGHRSPIFMWNPVVDDDLLRDHTYTAFRAGKFVRVPAIFGDDTHGGLGFVPKATETPQQVHSFLAAQFPALTRAHLAHIDALYANLSSVEPPTFRIPPDRGALWHALGTAYSEMRYMCPNMFTPSGIAHYSKTPNPNPPQNSPSTPARVPVRAWNYRYNVEVPSLMSSGYGVPHVAEQVALWGPHLARGRGWATYLSLNKPIVAEMRAYWLSFIRTYDPNPLRLKGSPLWEEWSGDPDPPEGGGGPSGGGASPQRRLVLQTNRTRMEDVDAGLRSRCAYLSSIAVQIQQ